MRTKTYSISLPKNKLNLLLSCLLIAFASMLTAQTYVNKEWVQTSGTPDETIDWQASVLDVNGDILITTNTTTAGQSTNILTIKVSAADGSILWEQEYNHPSNDKDYGTAIATDATGNVYVAGAANIPGAGYDFVVLKYAANGALQWSKTYDGISAQNDLPAAIAVDGAGNVYVTGGSQNGTALIDYCTIKYDANGNQLWLSHYDYNDLYDAPIALQIDPQGDIVVTGVSAENTVNWESATIKYDADDGTQIAENRIEQPAGIDEPADFTMDDNGNFYITGKTSTDGINYDIRTIKLTANLDIAWIQDYDAAGLEDAGASIDVDAQGNVFVGGYIHESGGVRKALVLRYDANGTQVSDETINTSTDTEMTIEHIKVEESTVLLTGKMETSGSSKMFARAQDTDNQILWQKQESGSTESTGKTILVSDNSLSTGTDSNVFITGTSEGGTNIMTTTTKYSKYKPPSDVVTDDEGTPLYMDRMVITRFHRNAVIIENIDNRNLTFGRAGTFLTPNAINTLNQNLSFDMNQAYLIKIFPQLSSTLKYSENRLGRQVRVPDFWTSFMVVLPEFAALSPQNTNTLTQVVTELEAVQSVVRYAHPNYIASSAGFGTEMSSAPNDTYYNSITNGQASLHYILGNPNSCDTCHINIEPAWNTNVGRPEIRVGIIDDGANWKHFDFGYDGFNQSSSVFKGGWDFKDTNTDLYNFPQMLLDSSWHGTGCAGIIGAVRNNAYGIAGIAGGTSPDTTGVSLYSLRIIQRGTSPVGIVNYAANAIASSALGNDVDSVDYDYGLHIQNHSWYFTSTPDSVQLVRDAVHFANRMQVILAAGRGNQGAAGGEKYPACYNDEWVMTIGASNESGNYAEFSEVGCNIDFVAPGGPLAIPTLDSDDNSSFQFFGGTSAATPHISGVAALMLSHANDSAASSNNLAPEDVEWILENTAKDMLEPLNPNVNPGYDDYTGHGLINAGKAMELLEFPYEVRHISSKTSPTDYNILQTAVDATLFYEEPYDVGGYPIDYNVSYTGDVYNITVTIEHNVGMDSIVGVWERHSMSNLFKEGTPLPAPPNSYDLLPHEQVYLENYTMDEAVLSGFVYHLKEKFVDGVLEPVNQWVPYDPYTQEDSLCIEYTLLLKNTTNNIITIDSKDIGLSIIPNPSEHTHTLSMSLPETTDVNITLYDMQGRLLNILHQGVLPQGENSINNDVSKLPSGMYVYRIISDKWQTADKFIKL